MNETSGDVPEGEGESHGLSWWRRLGQKLAGGPASRAEIYEVLDAAAHNGLIDADGLAMIRGVFETGELQVRDIMIPRAQMIVIESDWPLARIRAAVIEAGHSRFPVIGDSRDDILGILLAKDLLRFGDEDDFSLAQLLRKAALVPESKRLNIMLKDFRRSHQHMAIVVDEYGGVAGLVTIEDVLELIVGEIDDEYDESGAALIQKLDDRRYVVNALTPVAEFNEYFGAAFSDEEFDTIGGLVMHGFGHMPRRGESIEIGRYQFNVQRADNRRLHLLQVTVAPA